MRELALFSKDLLIALNLEVPTGLVYKIVVSKGDNDDPNGALI